MKKKKTDNLENLEPDRNETIFSDIHNKFSDLEEKKKFDSEESLKSMFLKNHLVTLCRKLICKYKCLY